MINESKKDLHYVWKYIAMNKFKLAAKMYVQKVKEKKENVFKKYDVEDDVNLKKVKTGLMEILSNLDKDISSRSFTGNKGTLFKEAVIDEIQRLMKGHPLGIKGYINIAKAAKEASKVEIKEEIIKNSLF